MAFKLKNLRCIGNNETTGVVPSLWLYWNEAQDTVTTAGFLDKDSGVKNGDQVMSVDGDYGNAIFYNAAVNSTTRVITLTANS